MRTLVNLFLILLPFQVALNLSQGIDLPFGRVLAVLVVLFCLAAALKKKSFIVSSSPLSLLLFLFLFWSGLSLFWADAFSIGFRKFIFLVNFIPLFWCIPNLTKLNFVRLGKMLIYPAFVVSLIGIGQFAAQFFIGAEGIFQLWAKIAPFLYGQSFAASILTFNSWLVDIGGNTLFRAIAFFPDPHMLGFYLAFVAPLALLSEKKLFQVFGGIFVIALLLTFSRQAYIGAAGALLVWFISRLSEKSKSKLKVKSFSFGFLLLFFILYSLFFIPPFNSRFLSSFSFSDGSVSGRFENWGQAVELIKEHPILGVGIGNYAAAIEPTADFRTPLYAHNLYLDIAAELGIVGLIFFLCILASAMVTSFRREQYAIFLTFIWFSVQALFDTPLYSVHILPLLIIFLAFSDNAPAHEIS